MSLAGSKITILDKEKGTEQTYTFTDSPLARWLGGIYEAAEAFGLSRSEAATLCHFAMFAKGEIGRVTPKIPPFVQPGMKALIKRGWAVKRSRDYRLVDVPELHTIFRSAERSVQFGESAGRA